MSRFPKRYRGVVLTQQGINRLESAIATAQDEEKYGKRFTQAELSDRANLSIKTIKKIRDRTAPVDEGSVRTLFEAFELSLEPPDYGLPELSAPSSDSEPAPHGTRLKNKIDWGEKPDTTMFFGRTEDLTILDQWVTADQCRLVTLLGMGGIGKTSLAAKLADQTYEQFDYVIWRSLREAPPLDEILVRIIQFLSDQQETDINLPTRLGERIIRLLHYLREHRCLLVLDNLESILQAESARQFRNGYEGYGELIHQIGAAEHQSCLLLTSRECPRELALVAGESLPVRLWPVEGIDSDAGQQILKAKGLNLENANNQAQELIRLYSGNPQALHLVATAIRREYLGDVNDFLEEEGAALEDVHGLLDQHLTRLAPLERSILFWLALNREPIGIEELMEDLLPPVTKRDVRIALRGLCDRYLIETVGKQFTLQNVIMEFVTDHISDQVRQELNTQQLALFKTHALIKATVKDYVRETQIRLILKPVVKTYENLFKLEKQLKQILTTLKASPSQSGYAGGNILNLLISQGVDLTDYDFSELPIHQAYLQGVELHKVNFENANLSRSIFNRGFRQISSIAVHPDGRHLAIGDYGGTIHLWRISDGKQISVFEGNGKFVEIAFSLDGDTVASGGEDRIMRLWDIKSHKCISFPEEHTFAITSLDFSPCGNFLATGSRDSTIKIWDLEKHKCINSLESNVFRVLRVRFSPDGQTLAVSGLESIIELWDVTTGQCFQILDSYSSSIDFLRFSSDEKLLVSGSRDQKTELWHLDTGQLLTTLEGERPIAVSSQEPILATYKSSGSNNAIGHLWKISQGQLELKKTFHESGSSFIGEFSPDSQFLVVANDYCTVKIRDTQTADTLKTLQGYENYVDAIVFHRHSNLLATGHHDKSIRVWNIVTGNCIKILKGHCGRINALTFCHNDQNLMSHSSDGTIKTWHIDSGKCIKSMSNGVSNTGGEFSIDKSLFFQWCRGIGERLTTIQVLDLCKEECIQTFPADIKLRWIMAQSPNGKYLARLTNDDKSIRTWDLKAGESIFILSGHTDLISSLAFSPDEKTIASGSYDKTIRLWHLNTGKCIRTLHGHSDIVCSVAFSPDGTSVVSGGRDKTIRLWEVATGKCIRTFQGHTDTVYEIYFSPDGERLVSRLPIEAVIKLWDVQTGQCIQTLESRRFHIAFSPDGKKFTSANSNGMIELFDAQTGEFLHTLAVPKLYDEMNVTGTTGLTDAQRASLFALGAVDCSCENSANI